MRVRFEVTETWILEVESEEDLAYLRKAERERKMDLYDSLIDDGELMARKISKGIRIK